MKPASQNTIKSPSRGAATNSRPGLRKIYASDAERQRARRIRRYAAGLNSQGRPYQRHPHFVNWAETPALRKLQIAEQRERKLQNNLARYHRLARANRAAGLRVDGQPFRRHPRFAAWKHFRAALAPAPLGNWERIER